jgi:regulator of sigma E protease
MFIKIAQLFLSLTILVTLHEFGHFWFAKKFKCRVDKFYLFFDFLFPFASVMNFALFKKKIGDTEYGIGWFPFGGYVQIAGMVDEQMDKSIVDTPPQPWELRSKPAWQRLLVMMGGILVNLVLGVVIFWLALFVWGKQALPITNVPHGLAVDSAAYFMGLRNGDYITSLDGMPVENINRIPIEIVMNGVSTIEGVHVTGERFTLPVDNDDRARMLKRMKKSNFVAPRYEFKIDSVDKTSFAANAGFKAGDRIVAMNGVPIRFFDEFKAELIKNRGKKAEITVQRVTPVDGRADSKSVVMLTSRISEQGMMGVITSPVEEFNVVERNFGLFRAFSEGMRDGIELMVMQCRQFVVLFTVKDAHQQVGGFYTMVQQMSSEWDWRQFWMFTGFLSMALAFLNFLPIPMLDGGYIMFILWEMVSGRKVSDKVIYYANNVGLFIVLGLMIYANTDWLRK